MRRNLNPNLRPEKQHTISKQGNLERPHIGQGRAGSKGKRPDPINHAINQASNLSQEIPGRTKIETRKTNHMYSTDQMHSINNTTESMANNNPLIPDVAFHPGPVYRPPPNPIKQDMTHAQSSQSTNMKMLILILILILRKIHHFMKALCLKCSKDQTNHSFRNLENYGTL